MSDEELSAFSLEVKHALCAIKMDMSASGVGIVHPPQEKLHFESEVTRVGSRSSKPQLPESYSPWKSCGQAGIVQSSRCIFFSQEFKFATGNIHALMCTEVERLKQPSLNM